jgi:hypothetical protein
MSVEPTVVAAPAATAEPVVAAPPAPVQATVPVTPSVAAPPAAVPSATRADGKPGWLPEKFKSEEDLSTGYKILETTQFTRRETLKAEARAELEAERLKDIPATAAEYKYEPLVLADGRKVEADPNDPRMEWFKEKAHSLRIPPAQYQELMQEFIQIDSQRGPSWEAESKLLGEATADMRLDRVDKWMRANSPKDLYGTFSTMPAQAGTIKMFEHMMMLAGEPAFVPSEGGMGFQQNVTKESITALQASEGYRKGDPAVVQQVRAGWRRLAQQNGQK